MGTQRLLLLGTVALLIIGTGLAGCGKKEEPRPEVVPSEKIPPPAPAVTSVSFAKGVDINWAAVTPTSEFKPSDRINVAIRTENAVPGNQLLVKWIYMGTNQLVKADSVVLQQPGLNNSAFYIERAKGFPTGVYELSVFLNGTLTRSGDFKVVK